MSVTVVERPSTVPTVSLVKRYAPTGPVSEATLITRLWRQEIRNGLHRNDLNALATDLRRQCEYDLPSVVASAAWFRR